MLRTVALNAVIAAYTQTNAEDFAAKDNLYTVGFVSRKRSFRLRLKPNSGFLTQSKKEHFRLNFLAGVSHGGSNARYRCYSANNGYACCSFGGSRLRETSRT